MDLEKRFKIYVCGKYGFADYSGKVIIPPVYDNVSDFQEGLAAVKSNGKKHYIDLLGKQVINAGYDILCPFCDGLACVVKDDRYGFIYKTGVEVIPLVYEHANYFQEGFTSVKLNGESICINSDGKMFSPTLRYEWIGRFSEGLASVWRNGKCGYINTYGIEVIPLKYVCADSFKEGLAMVKKDMFANLGIDKAGQEIFCSEHEMVYGFSEGYAPVLAFNGKYGYIDKSGHETFLPYMMTLMDSAKDMLR